MPVNTVAGLSSGIKWNEIIDAFVASDRASTAVIERRKDTFKLRLDGVRTLNTRMLSLQLDIGALNRSTTYSTRSATVSDTTAATATARNTASEGSLTLDVVSIAKAHQRATAGISSATSPQGAGTIFLSRGGGSVSEISIPADASSLSDISNAINANSVGIRAAVVNTGVGANPYQLLLTSSTTGSEGRINVTTDGAMDGLFAGMSTVTNDDNAVIRIGGGGGATPIELTQSSNTFADIMPGVDLVVKKPVTGLQVSTGTDTTMVKEKINAFVTSYNGIIDEVKRLASYDPATKSAGVLFSESDIRRGMQNITQRLLTAVPGLPSNLSTITSLGISVDRNSGRLTVDAAMLDSKLASNADGVAKIFTNTGTASQSGVSFAALNEKTNTSSPFTINITSAATQATLNGSALGPTTVINASNKSLVFSINGTSRSLTLAEGSYDPAALATHVQSVINSSTANKSEQVDVTLDSGALKITSRQYGFSATLQAGPGSTALAALGLNSVTSRGTDVEGTINGVAGTGSGQVLSGATGTAAEGLRVIASTNAPISNVSLTVRKGMAQGLSEVTRSLTDNTNGLFAVKDRGLNETITRIEEQVKNSDERLELRRQRYTQMFLAMERSINQSNSLGSFISGQISGFENAARARSN